MQNRQLKVPYQLDWLTPTMDLHWHLSLLTIKDSYVLQVAKFVFKQRHDILPQTFQGCFSCLSVHIRTSLSGLDFQKNYFEI